MSKFDERAFHMSVYEKLIKTLENSTPDEYFNLLHPDYIFVRHQSGEQVSKEDWMSTVISMYNAMNEGKLTFTNNRCLYENDDILVMHQIGTFPDGSKESILVVHTLNAGKILKTESGATPLK